MASEEAESQAEQPPLMSVDDAMPSEQGGPVARVGFDYQDHIASALLIEMLDTPAIAKVHCESHDDAIVVWQPNGTEDKVALLAVDPKIRIALAPTFVRAVETELGPGMVKLSGGVSLDKIEKDKPKWAKRRGGDDEE